MTPRVALDWDNTLVNTQTQDWLPGARTAIRSLQARGYDVLIHSCRANWPEGLAAIKAKLAEAHLNLSVHAKPDAAFYVDDKALRITCGDYKVLAAIPPTVAAVRGLRATLGAR